MKKPTAGLLTALLIALAVLFFAMLSCDPAHAQTGNGLLGVYTSATQTLTRNDAPATFVFSFTPATPPIANFPGNFSTEWTGTLSIPYTGSYTFVATSAGGVKVYLGGNPVITDWTLHASRKASSNPIARTAGAKIPIIVDYQQSGSGAVTLTWQGPGIPTHSVPTSRLYSTPTQTTVTGLPPNVINSASTVPTNLRVKGSWLPSGQPTDILTWDAVPGPVSYNVYQYDVLIATKIPATTFTVPSALFNSAKTYTVTSVDAKGNESIPSAIAFGIGAFDPTGTPEYIQSPPSPPGNLMATGEWNAGGPRIHLTWSDVGNEPSAYNVYRDGTLVAAGLGGQSYEDGNVTPGARHAYTVTATTTPWKTTLETAQSASVSGEAPIGPPTRSATLFPVTIIPNDDSDVVSFPMLPGAVDARVYVLGSTGDAKYAGVQAVANGIASIEMNGLDPTMTQQLVVEQLDKLGPFQKNDGAAGPGGQTMPGMGMGSTNTNGQGDPSNVPNVIASSAPIQTMFKPFTLTGTQQFIDTFRGENPLTVAVIPPLMVKAAGGGELSAVENDKWTFYQMATDTLNTRIFFMGNHFMWTTYDGGIPGPGGDSNPPHNENGSIVLMPKATEDISAPGSVLHVTFEVDAHFGSRRWMDIFVGAAGDQLIAAGKFSQFASGNDSLPTVSGNLFRWEIQAGVHDGQLFEGWKTPGVQLNAIELFDEANGVGTDSFGPANRSTLNGTTQDLDKRHRYDLYLSKTHYRMMENGIVVKDHDFPAATPLPYSKLQVYVVHEVYHTGNDHGELIQNYPSERYWISYRPWADMRHCDNVGISVLPAFPPLAASPVTN